MKKKIIILSFADENNINDEININVKDILLEFEDWSYKQLQKNEEEIIHSDFYKNTKNDTIEEYRKSLQKSLKNHEDNMQDWGKYILYNTTKKVKQYSGVGTTYSLTKFNELLTEKYKQTIDNILINNIYKHQYNAKYTTCTCNEKYLNSNELLAKRFEVYNNTKYELTDDDKKLLLNFKDFAYKQLQLLQYKCIINDFIESSRCDNTIINDYKLILRDSDSEEMKKILNKYEFRNYIIDILHTNIYEFVYNRYQNSTKEDKNKIDKYLSISPDYRKAVWISLSLQNLYTRYQETNDEGKNVIDNTLNNYPEDIKEIWNCIVKNKGYLPPSIFNFLYSNNIYDDITIMNDYFDNCNKVFNAFQQQFNINNINFYAEAILCGFITNPKIIEYLKPLIEKIV